MDPRAERTRNAALKAALALLLQEGPAAVNHARVAERSGVGRRTMYRHWATRRDLLHDTLSGASFPVSDFTGDVTADVRRHLEQLRSALVDGPLAGIVITLAANNGRDPELESLRSRLVEAGCAPLRRILGQRSGSPPGTGHGTEHIELLIAELEGPLFYCVCIKNEIPSDALIDDLVDRVLSVTRAPRPDFAHNE
jgi:AcrR family transcriptional regulator